MSIRSYIRFELLKSKGKRNLIACLLLVYLVNLASFFRFQSNVSLLYQYVDKPDCDFSTYCLLKLSVIHRQGILLMVICYFVDIFLAQKIHVQNAGLIPIRTSVAYLGDLMITWSILAIFLLGLGLLVHSEIDSFIPAVFWDVSILSKSSYFNQIALEAFLFLIVLSLIGTSISQIKRVYILMIGIGLVLMLMKTHLLIGDVNIQILKNICKI